MTPYTAHAGLRVCTYCDTATDPSEWDTHEYECRVTRRVHLVTFAVLGLIVAGLFAASYLWLESVPAGVVVLLLVPAVVVLAVVLAVVRSEDR